MKRMNIQILLLFIMVACLGVLLPACTPAEPLADANVIVILIDTLRSDYVGAYNPERKLTPSMDLISREGAYFRNAIAPSSWTKPSVASLMTGLYPGRHGTVKRGFEKKDSRGRFSLDPGLTTLSEELNRAGYSTAAFATNPNIIPSLHFDKGYDHFMQPAGIANELFDQATAWIEANRGKGKFHLYLHLLDPHLPYFPPEDYRERFIEEPFEEAAPFTRLGQSFEIDLWIKQYKHWEPEGPGDRFKFDFDQAWAELVEKFPDKANHIDKAQLAEFMFLDFEGYDDPALKKRVDHLISLYEGEVVYTDDAIQEFVKMLETEGLLDNTILVVTADHGEAFLEHDLWGHDRSVHWEEVNVPLIFRIPGEDGPVKGTFDEAVSLVDVYPTILDLVGLPLPESLDGTSLKPILLPSNRAFRRERPVFTELIGQTKDLVAAIFQDRKVIREVSQDGELAWYYFELDSDPEEQVPLDLDEGDDRVKALKRSIESFIKNRSLDRPGDENEGQLTEEEIEEMRKLGYL
jgi:arylsulfatase A-like enzyme